MYYLKNILVLSQLGLQDTPTAFVQRGKTFQTSVLYMTLHNLIVSLQ